MDRLSVTDAEELLDGLPLVPVMAGSIPEMKALRDRCLAAGIPAIVGCPPGSGGGSRLRSGPSGRDRAVARSPRFAQLLAETRRGNAPSALPRQWRDRGAAAQEEQK